MDAGDADYAKNVATSPNATVGVDHSWITVEDTEDAAIFTNLYNNKEAFTGFNGTDIWQKIYDENCFNVRFSVRCNEERLLYRIISGIHASISTHIAEYYIDRGSGITYRNHQEFVRRVGKYKDRLENMYFVFSFVLTAYDKLQRDIPAYVFTHSNNTEEKNLHKLFIRLQNHYQNSNFIPLKDDELLTTLPKPEFIEQIHPVFFNITRLVD